MRCDQESRAVFKTRWYNGAMNIRRVSERSKRDYLQLLLLADEQEDMIDRYLGRGTMFVLDIAGKTVGVCVVTDEGDRMLEIKNLAVDPAYQRRGLGRALIEFIARNAKGTYETLQVGTGDSPLTVPFYEACGFVRHHRIDISSSTTTTTLSWRRAFCLKIWFTCGEAYKSFAAREPGEPGLPKRLVEHHGSGV